MLLVANGSWSEHGGLEKTEWHVGIAEQGVVSIGNVDVVEKQRGVQRPCCEFSRQLFGANGEDRNARHERNTMCQKF